MNDLVIRKREVLNTNIHVILEYTLIVSSTHHATTHLAQ